MMCFVSEETRGLAISQETQLSSLEIFFMSRRRSEMVCRVTPNCFANCFCVWLNSQPVFPPKRGLSIKLQSPLWTKMHTYRMMQYLRWESDKSICLHFYYIFLVAIHEEYSDGYALCAYTIIDVYELIIFQDYLATPANKMSFSVVTYQICRHQRAEESFRFIINVWNVEKVLDYSSVWLVHRQSGEIRT